MRHRARRRARVLTGSKPLIVEHVDPEPIVARTKGSPGTVLITVIMLYVVPPEVHWVEPLGGVPTSIHP